MQIELASERAADTFMRSPHDGERRYEYRRLDGAHPAYELWVRRPRLEDLPEPADTLLDDDDPRVGMARSEDG